ncbi:hypothetical protein VIBNIMADA3020_730048 [Vibrio nigripulchritudo MADA3020]|nr:hypothetical protein VIBNIMADA3020_730048 [Vibrio nigripulchritudo MADA3020]
MPKEKQNCATNNGEVLETTFLYELGDEHAFHVMPAPITCED